MTHIKNFFVLILSMFYIINTNVNCVRHDVHEMMYKTFDGAPACFRRLNGTHQFGCSSPRGGSYGVIHFIQNKTDLTNFLENAVADPYVVVLNPDLFRRNEVDLLIASNKVSGIVLNKIPSVTVPTSFSPDDDCPNKYSNVNGTCNIKWNPIGNSFLLYDWPIPIFLVNNEDHYKAIIDCHNKFNIPLDSTQHSRPLCSLHLNSHMFAAVNSETCLRRINYYGVNPTKYCDPLGDENVALPTLPWKQSKNKDVIIVGARMDALSMFDGIAPGAMSAATGLVTLISTAYVLHKMIEQNQVDSNMRILFVLFNGESNDYIGSGRAVFDMVMGTFPSKNKNITMDNIKLFIEFSQLSSTNKVYVHHNNDKEVDDFLNQLNGTAFDLLFESSNTQVLPPTSFQSFHKENKNLGGVILSNFDKTYINKYYNSIFDTSTQLDYIYANGSMIDKTYELQNRLAGISYLVASYLYNKATHKNPLPFDNQTIELVDELLHCYIETRRCNLIKEVGAVASNKVPDLLPLYVGVRNNPENYVARVTGSIIAYLTGKKLSITRENCVNDENNKDFSLFWMNGKSGNGECINSSILFTPAESPAFIIENYNWKSGEFPTWTESVWGASNLGMFIKPYRVQEVVVLLIGIMVFLVSSSTVYWFHKNAEGYIFTQIPPTTC